LIFPLSPPLAVPFSALLSVPLEEREEEADEPEEPELGVPPEDPPDPDDAP